MKRLTDIAVSVVLLLLLLPLMISLSFLIWTTLGTPLLFRQSRTGLNGKPFEMIKFRTMRDVTDSSGEQLPDGERLTTVGRFIRAFSLDELPELWNVLKGDMSLVGPRPLLPEYLPLYAPEQFRRHEVRPGITGLAQINGRNAISWEQKFEYDVWYVDNRNIFLDVVIMLKTLLKVFRREGISANGDATMPRFVGSTRKNGRLNG